jgi:class 3 adenylate cyclase
LGWARAEAVAPKGSTDAVRRRAEEAARVGRRHGLFDVAREATALTLSELDDPRSVARRGGDWCVVMLTDIVGSTEVSRVAGDRTYYELVNEHHHIVRGCLATHSGTEFSETGDGLFAWFTSTRDAVRCALSVQRQLALRTPSRPDLKVRVAVAGGEPLVSGGRPFGLVLNRAARLVGLAEGGQIVVDEAVAAEAEEWVPLRRAPVVELRGLGGHQPAFVST